VTALDDAYPGKVAVLLGPYETHQETLNNVHVGEGLAMLADTRAPQYLYGTCAVFRKEADGSYSLLQGGGAVEKGLLID